MLSTAFAITGCSAAPPAEPTPAITTPNPGEAAAHLLQVANDQCNPGGVFDAKVHLSGDKRSLSVTDDTGVPLNCVLNALGASDGTIARVLTVRPIDGELEAQWDSFDAHWKYLVDVGVQLVVEVDS